MHVNFANRRWFPWSLLAIGVIATAIAYWPGLSGGWLFDDYPNIVDNHGVQPQTASASSLVRAALSSPSSEFKRPLASLSFAANYLVEGLHPWGWKLTNLLIHLLNGLLVFTLAQGILRSIETRHTDPFPRTAGGTRRAGVVAALIAVGWLLLPINITAVLYVVQRMESMANLFVLLGLIGYLSGRRLMLRDASASWRGYWLGASSLVMATGIGLLAKETAVMLPLYAVLIEWIVFGFERDNHCKDQRILSLFTVVLLLPMVAGLAWLIPGLLNPAAWATRDFTMATRLLSEARIVVDYIVWTLLPTPHALSFYHDDFRISTGLLQPWTTLACILVLAAMLVAVPVLRKRRPLVALGMALFLGCHLLTATILPLELIFEHRNYFASFGLLLVVVPALAPIGGNRNFALARGVLLGGLMLLWTGQTLVTSMEWSNPLSMAQSFAERRPTSPRAEYELGRTYIILSNYDPASPFTKLAYAPLERSAALPDSPILAEQALIFFNARMHLPIKDAWWDSLIAKLKAHAPGVQDESSLGALTQCARDGLCALSRQRMITVYLTALGHPNPRPRLLASYGDYAWNVLDDHPLGLRMTREAVKAAPGEPAYQVTLIRMLVAQGERKQAMAALQALGRHNIGGNLDHYLIPLRSLVDGAAGTTP